MRIVDDAEPLVQHAQAVHGVARGRFHRLADAVGHRIQPLVDRARHLGLAAGQRLPHRIDAAGGLVLRLQHLAEALFQLVGADRLRHRQFGAAAAGARDHDGDDQQQDKRERAEADQRVNGADRPVADHKNNLVHGLLVADSPAYANEEGTFMVNSSLIFVVNTALKIMVKPAVNRFLRALTPANQQLKSPVMAIREIIILPDKQLRLVSRPVEKVTAEIRKLADDMFETMYDAPGIGLAAIQVAQPLRLITMDLAKKDEDGETRPQPRVFINPEIVSSSEDLSVYEEGCLSIPEYYEEVERPARVRVRFTDLDGKVHEEDADGLFATCIQHEIDHLNGVLFVDYLSKLKRDRVLKKFTKAAKRAAE